MGILEKFSKIEADPKERLSNEDMAYCDRLTREANEILAELKVKYVVIADEYSKETMGYKINSNRYVTRPTDNYEKFNRYKWTNAFDVLHLQTLVVGLVHSYKEKILDYFADKYNLSLCSRHDGSAGKLNSWRDDLKGEDQFNPLDYDAIMEHITAVTGGLNFKEVGEKAFIESFQRHFKVWRDNAPKHSIKGATMKVEDFYKLYPEYSGFKYKNDSTYLDIERAFNFFETGDLTKTEDRSMYNLIGERCDFNEIIFSDLTKINSIKFFKNGRADIKFASATYANEFSKLFELDSLKDKG